MSQKAAFFDRDGTINVNYAYVYKIEDLVFISGIPEKIREFNEKKIPVLVVTNQAGIARGFYTMDDVNRFHLEMNRRLQEEYDAKIDDFFICPHHPDFTGPCACRKPKNGLFLQAQKKYSVDFSKSILFGDKESDRLAGLSVGITQFHWVHCDENV